MDDSALLLPKLVLIADQPSLPEGRELVTVVGSALSALPQRSMIVLERVGRAYEHSCSTKQRLARLQQLRELTKRHHALSNILTPGK